MFQKFFSMVLFNPLTIFFYLVCILVINLPVHVLRVV